MNLRRLKYFVKIVDIGSLTQAADVLHIAQPALSQQIATLEGEFSQQLLVRTKRGEVMAKELRRQSAKRIELASLNPAHPNYSFELPEIAWMHRIVWASQ